MEKVVTDSQTKVSVLYNAICWEINVFRKFPTIVSIIKAEIP